MSVIYESDEVAIELLGNPVKSGRTCFFCDKPLAFPFVNWMSDFELLLHPRCVTDLAIRLFRDLYEVQCAVGRDATHGLSPDHFIVGKKRTSR